MLQLHIAGMLDKINSADREGVARAVRDLFSELDAAIAAYQPACRTCGRCCRFEEYGHQLYVTAVELLYFQGMAHQSAPQGAEPAETLDACPYQAAKVCTVRAARPLGCRIFFCDPAAQAWQNDLYERYHTRLRQLHERFGIPYVYREWRQALRTLAKRETPTAPKF